jgi:hypothetical protein
MEAFCLPWCDVQERAELYICLNGYGRMKRTLPVNEPIVAVLEEIRRFRSHVLCPDNGGRWSGNRVRMIEPRYNYIAPYDIKAITVVMNMPYTSTRNVRTRI